MIIENFFTYLTYSDEDLKWQLVCTHAGATEIEPHSDYPPNVARHPSDYQSVVTGRTLHEYVIIYITNGRGTFYSQGQEYEVIPGTILFLFPGIKHAYKPDFETGWDEYWVGFEGKYIDLLYESKVIDHNRPVFYVGLHDVIITHFHTIFRRIKKQKPYYQMRASANIMMLIADIFSYTKDSAETNNAALLVDKIKCLFEENLYATIELEEIAAKLNLSSSYVGDVFKSYTGMTPYQYFLHLKVNKAKEMLEAGELSIKEIAYTLAFEDQYYFSRLFKKKTGVSPSKWTEFYYVDTKV